MRVLSQNKIPVHQVGDVCGRSCDHYLFHLGTVPVSLDSKPSLVAAVIPRKYKMVGLQLGLTQDELQAIRPQHQSVLVVVLAVSYN